MYEAYWKLEAKPFETTTDPRFYYPSESHQGALLKLRYAVENRRGGALLSGQAGLGKTLLIQTLQNQLPPEYTPFVHVVFPQMPPDQLVAYIAAELAAASRAGSRASTPATLAESITQLKRLLAENVEAARHAVVVIDEAHVLQQPAVLETIRLLMNFEFQTQAAMTILLAGQASLLPILDRTPELDERLAVKCLLRRFTLEESISYVTHRLRAAGGSEAIFEEAALEAIHRNAHGIPRRINRLCDLALLIGFAEEREVIDHDQIESIGEELVTVTPE